MSETDELLLAASNLKDSIAHDDAQKLTAIGHDSSVMKPSEAFAPSKTLASVHASSEVELQGVSVGHQTSAVGDRTSPRHARASTSYARKSDYSISSNLVTLSSSSVRKPCTLTLYLEHCTWLDMHWCHQNVREYVHFYL
jgi:hypothetical protein